MARILSGLAIAFLALGLFGCERRPTGNEITLRIRTFALNLDPATLAETDSRKVATLLYTGLVAVDADGNVRPRIAKSWRRVDANTWAFTLADRVTFPDGSPVTSQKVVQSLCASMQPSDVQAWSLVSIAHVPNGKNAVSCTGLGAPDASTVTVRETRSTPWLLEALAGPGGWIVDVSAKPGAYGVRPGTGPYLVKSITSDQQIVLVGRSGAALRPAAAAIRVLHIPDDGVAARDFSNGRLDLLEVDTPQLRDLELTPAGALRAPGALHRSSSDRVRVVGFNLKRMAARGLTPSQLHGFIANYSAAIQRAQISQRAHGLATPMSTGFPPASPGQPQIASAPPPNLPVDLTLLTENDPFSDMVGAMLPTQIGQTRIHYEAVDKSLLISALLKGDYDLALLKIEATHHTPRFWAAFFTPGDPYTAFGTGIPGMERIDLSQPHGLRQAQQLVDREGNWVGVFREIELFATAPGLSGVRLTPSGQLSLEEIGRGR